MYLRACVPLRVPSQNDFQYSHWRKYYRVKRLWLLHLRAEIGYAQQQITTPVKAVITSYRSLLLDHANLVGGAKPIPDCLKTLGWIVDDSEEWFRCDYEQIKCKRKEERTIIILEDDTEKA